MTRFHSSTPGKYWVRKMSQWFTISGVCRCIVQEVNSKGQTQATNFSIGRYCWPNSIQRQVYKKQERLPSERSVSCLPTVSYMVCARPKSLVWLESRSSHNLKTCRPMHPLKHGKKFNCEHLLTEKKDSFTGNLSSLQ